MDLHFQHTVLKKVQNFCKEFLLKLSYFTVGRYILIIQYWALRPNVLQGVRDGKFFLPLFLNIS